MNRDQKEGTKMAQRLTHNTCDPARLPDIMLISEAAPILRTNRETLRQMILRGEIEAYQFGKRWHIPKKEVLRLARFDG